jgi:hypothetical protein
MAGEPEIRMPPCKHTVPSEHTALVSVISMGVPRCSFCERERLEREVLDLRAELRREQDARAALRIEINALRPKLKQLQLAAPVMLTVMALLADEADLEGLREIGLWYNEQEPEHLKLWLDAEHARSAREQAGAKEVVGG